MSDLTKLMRVFFGRSNARLGRAGAALTVLAIARRRLKQQPRTLARIRVEPGDEFLIRAEPAPEKAGRGRSRRKLGR